MSDPNFFILYVASPEVSTKFYTALLGRPPVDASPTFAMFALASGVMFGLWARDTVEPKTTVTGGGAELAFPVESKAAVDARHADWVARGLPILQAPVMMDFGYTFLALDPDGHRLRVFVPNAP
jgi:catechol 2,3-dioxygenase-like lactoylglutathione lyase family enzyme